MLVLGEDIRGKRCGEGDGITRGRGAQNQQKVNRNRGYVSIRLFVNSKRLPITLPPLSFAKSAEPATLTNNSLSERPVLASAARLLMRITLIFDAKTLAVVRRLQSILR